jgi:hypothetical protein
MNSASFERLLVRSCAADASTLPRIPLMSIACRTTSERRKSSVMSFTSREALALP